MEIEDISLDTELLESLLALSDFSSIESTGIDSHINEHSFDDCLLFLEFCTVVRLDLRGFFGLGDS